MGYYGDDDDYYYRPYQATLSWGFFYVSAWLGYLFCIAFGLFSVACGLFYLAELTEEYSVLTCKFLRLLVSGLIGLYALLLLVDGLCWWRCLLSIAANISYSTLLRNFPWVRLGSLSSIASGFFFVLDTVSWYSYFHSAIGKYPYWSIVSFLAIGCWAAPIGFFVSVALEEEQLPMSARSAGGAKQKVSLMTRLRSLTGPVE